jgi:hypothetical protein
LCGNRQRAVHRLHLKSFTASLSPVNKNTCNSTL